MDWAFALSDTGPGHKRAFALIEIGNESWRFKSRARSPHQADPHSPGTGYSSPVVSLLFAGANWTAPGAIERRRQIDDSAGKTSLIDLERFMFAAQCDVFSVDGVSSSKNVGIALREGLDQFDHAAPNLEVCNSYEGTVELETFGARTEI